jgi:hypothetical protein
MSDSDKAMEAIAQALTAAGDPCQYSRDSLLKATSAHLLRAHPASGETQCILCMRTLMAHRTIASLGIDVAPASGSKRPAMTRLELEKTIKRSRRFGPCDAAEVTDIVSKPFEFMRGLANMIRARAAGTRLAIEALPRAESHIDLKLYQAEPRLPKGEAERVVALEQERADGLDILTHVISDYWEQEFKPIEAANTTIRVFNNFHKELAAGFALETHITEPDDFVKISRAVRLGRKDEAQSLYADIFLNTLKKEYDEKIKQVKTLSAAATAGRQQATTAAGTAATRVHTAAAVGVTPAPQKAVASGAGAAPLAVAQTQAAAVSHVPGRNGKVVATHMCTTCRRTGHMAGANCPTKDDTKGAAGRKK